MASRSESKSQDDVDCNTAVTSQVAPAGFVKIGNPPNKSELVAQQNVFALNKRHT